MIKPWDVIDRRDAYTCPIFKIRQKTVRSPRTGRTHEVQAIHTPSWIMVLALTPAREVVMVRQYRHGIEDFCLELPGGLLDPGDDSAQRAAERELLEETGYTVAAIEPIGRCFPQPAVLANECFFFFGRDAVPVRGQDLDAGEDMDIVTVPLADVPAMVRQGRITHGMVLLAFYYFGLR